MHRNRYLTAGAPLRKATVRPKVTFQFEAIRTLSLIDALEPSLNRYLQRTNMGGDSAVATPGSGGQVGTARDFWGRVLENKALPAPKPAKFVKTRAEFLKSG